MGVDLCLMPFYSNSPECYFSHELLELDLTDELHREIRVIQNQFGQDVPKGFTSFRGRDSLFPDPCYGKTKMTPYGEPLKAVPAKYLKPFRDIERVHDYGKNKAIWAFICECPDDLMIALYWH